MSDATEPKQRRGRQEYFVAPPDEVEVLATDRVVETGAPTSIWGEACAATRSSSSRHY